MSGGSIAAAGSAIRAIASLGSCWSVSSTADGSTSWRSVCVGSGCGEPRTLADVALSTLPPSEAKASPRTLKATTPTRAHRCFHRDSTGIDPVFIGETLETDWPYLQVRPVACEALAVDVAKSQPCSLSVSTDLLTLTLFRHDNATEIQLSLWANISPVIVRQPAYGHSKS